MGRSTEDAYSARPPAIASAVPCSGSAATFAARGSARTWSRSIITATSRSCSTPTIGSASTPETPRRPCPPGRRAKRRRGSGRRSARPVRPRASHHLYHGGPRGFFPVLLTDSPTGTLASVTRREPSRRLSGAGRLLGISHGRSGKVSRGSWTAKYMSCRR